MHTLLINDNEDYGRKVGSAFWAGRWIWFISRKWEFSASWYLLRRAINAIAVQVEWASGDGSDGIRFHLAIPRLFSFFVEVEGFKFLRRFKGARETGISYHGGVLYIHILSKSMEWSRRDPWWVRGLTFHIEDWLIGRRRYREENATEWQEIVVPMPEGSYRGRVRFFDGVWRRRFWSNRLRRCDVKMDEPIPHPGKGENSWDCDEDATHSSTMCCSTTWEAIGKMVEGSMRSRCKYANGVSWRPKAKALV